MAAEAQIRLSLIDRVTGPLRRLQARLARLSSGLGLDRITRSIGNVGQSFVNIGSSAQTAIGRITGLTSLLGLGGAGVIAGGFALTGQVSDLAKEITNLSAVANVAPTDFQRLAYAARSVGIEQDKLADILKDMNDRVGDFLQTGGGPMADFFEKVAPKIGITKDAFRDLSGAEALQLFYSSLEKANLSQAEMVFYLEAMASDATLLQPLLAKNGEGFRRLGDEAARTGNIIGEDVLEYTKRYRAAVSGLTGRLTGLRNIIGVELLPTVTRLTEGLTAWFDANAVLIRSKITEWVGTLTQFMSDLVDPSSAVRQSIQDLTDGFLAFVDAITPVVDFLGGPLQTAFILAAFWISAPMISALALLGGAFIKLGAVILATPIGWIIAGVAALAAAVYLVYTEWDAFVGYWEGVWQRIQSAFDGSWSAIGAALLEFWPGTHVIRAMDYVVEYLTGFSLLDAGLAIVQSLWDGFTQGFFAVDAWLAQKEAEVLSYFNVDLTAIGSAVVSSFLTGLQAAWGGVVEWFKGAVSSLTAWVPDTIKAQMGIDVQTSAPAITPPTPGMVPFGAGEMVPSNPTPGPADFKAPTIDATAIRQSTSVSLLPVPAAPAQMAADSLQTQTVDAAQFNVPEPLLVHKPQSIDASTHVGSVVLHGVPMDNSAAVKAAVSDALREQSKRNADAVRSELAD